MSWPSVYAWQDELSAAELQAALDAAKQDAERVRKEFAESLPPGSPTYDAEWTTRYGSKNRTPRRWWQTTRRCSSRPRT